ncbi:NAD-dependent epimerase/dehydratase family protein [Methanoplanus endosymbiosus]|uniref:NAD-dependent epimerase/dehydratase family protein n=1 Tax=Methanoplanus endosymbiosus TaxID=33865 RepID=A0A9E7PJT8_9EURY|nr:NAD-dependent epimerase/dehydratase family protein [Methanoplanus endosymbiosus]UUX91265.1 NAD-dependent epimerase/dehydratase family protein [Methanoplanus endosymbiosus]
MYSVITGGAGFIGSHLVDALVKRGDKILIIDNLSSGNLDNITEHIESGKIEFLKADLLSDGWQDSFAGADRIYHIAADPDVRASAVTPAPIFDNNVAATENVLEAMRIHNVPEIVFTSTSTVYGEATVIPTPEDYSPMIPISIYGATKMACEAMIASYAHSFNMKAWVFRFANIIGERNNHGVIWDFIHKLKENPKELEILGDGKQVKSYLSVTGCVNAVLFAVENSDETFNFYNIGSEDWISVTEIGEIITEEMNLKGVPFCYTGGDRGWVGDVPKMQLSVEKMKSIGWIPEETSKGAVRAACKSSIREICGEN